VHAKAAEIGQRIKNDAAYRAEYKADPVAAMVSAGLPEDAAQEMVAAVIEKSGKDDVRGYIVWQIRYQYYDFAGWLHTVTDWYTDWGVFLYETDHLGGGP
jgi:hypothetical protein